MTDKNDPFSDSESTRTKDSEIDYRVELEEYIKRGRDSNVEKFQNFTKYIPTPDMRKFVCKYELYKKMVGIQGVIVEAGVWRGGGLMTWAHLSEIFEPFNYTRQIIGFDTFSGFASVSDNDEKSISRHAKEGGLNSDSYEDLKECVEIFEESRVLKHIPKVQLVKGDVAETLPAFLEENPYLVVGMLYLDFDLYEPTVHALRHLLPRMPKGSIIGFDELNNNLYVGETVAVMEEIGLPNLKIERFPFGIAMSYAVIE
jgi:hypothetical protein